MSFGMLVKDLRGAMGKSLRQFCADHGHDPSNWSKMERGLLPPPKDSAILKKWTDQLGLKKGSPAFETFIYEAAVSRGEIPEDILKNKALTAKLPALFLSLKTGKRVV